MSVTYSPCPQCRKLNRVPLGQGRRPVCGNCKSELALHDGINEISGAGLMALIEKSPLPVVADFWAPWCGPCRAFAPSFKKAAQALAGEVVFAKIDTQSNPLAGDTYHVRSIPTLIVFRNGLEQARQTGAMPYELFMQWVAAAAKRPAA